MFGRAVDRVGDDLVVDCRVRSRSNKSQSSSHVGRSSRSNRRTCSSEQRPATELTPDHPARRSRVASRSTATSGPSRTTSCSVDEPRADPPRLPEGVAQVRLGVRLGRTRPTVVRPPPLCAAAGERPPGSRAGACRPAATPSTSADQDLEAAQQADLRRPIFDHHPTRHRIDPLGSRCSASARPARRRPSSSCEPPVSVRSRPGLSSARLATVGGIAELRILGPLEVVTESGRLELNGHRERVVLAVLALTPGIDRSPWTAWSTRCGATRRRHRRRRSSRTWCCGCAGCWGRRRSRPKPVATGWPATPSRSTPPPSNKACTTARNCAAPGSSRPGAAALAEAQQRWRGLPLPELEAWAPGVVEATRLAELLRGAEDDRVEADLARSRHHRECR